MKHVTFKTIRAAALGGILTVAAVAPANAEPQTFGSIGLFGGTDCPLGSVEAVGQLMMIVEDQSLYALYGTLYGGDGRTTFALPDLRDKASALFGITDGGRYCVRTTGRYPSMP